MVLKPRRESGYHCPYAEPASLDNQILTAIRSFFLRFLTGNDYV